MRADYTTRPHTKTSDFHHVNTYHGRSSPTFSTGTCHLAPLGFSLCVCCEWIAWTGLSSSRREAPKVAVEGRRYSHGHEARCARETTPPRAGEVEPKGRPRIRSASCDSSSSEGSRTTRFEPRYLFENPSNSARVLASHPYRARGARHVASLSPGTAPSPPRPSRMNTFKSRRSTQP